MMIKTNFKLSMENNIIPIRDYLWESYLIKYVADISKKLDEASTKEEGESILINHTLDFLLLSRINTNPGLMLQVHDEILASKDIQEKTKINVLRWFNELSALEYDKEVKQDAISTNPYSIAYYDYWRENTKDSNAQIYEHRAASMLKKQQESREFILGDLMAENHGYLPIKYDFSPDTGILYRNRNIRKKDHSRPVSNDENKVRSCISKSVVLQSQLFSELKHLLLDGNDSDLFDYSIFLISLHNWFSQFSISEKTKILNSTIPFRVNENFVKTLFEKGTDGYKILYILTSSLCRLKYFQESLYLSEYLYNKNLDEINKICGGRYFLSSNVALSYQALAIYDANSGDCNKSACDWFKQALDDYKLLNEKDKARLATHLFRIRIQLAETEYKINRDRNGYRNRLKKIYRDSHKITATGDCKTVLRSLITSCQDTSNFDDELYYLKEYFKENPSKYNAKDPLFQARLSCLSSLQNNKSNLQNYKKKSDLKKLQEKQIIENCMDYCKHFLSEDQYDRVLTYLEDQLTRFPKNAELLRIKAETLYLVNDLKGVVETYSELLDSGSDIDKETKWVSLMGRAVARTELSGIITDEIKLDISSALDVFDNLPNKNDDEIRESLSNHFCQIIEKIAHWNDVEKECLFAIEINEAFNKKFESIGWHHQAILFIADSFFDSLLFDEAGYWYTLCIAAFKTFPIPYVKLGKIEMERGNLDLAQSHLNEACKLNSDLFEVLSAQVTLCLKQRDYLRAIVYVNRCKEICSDDDPNIRKEFEKVEWAFDSLSNQYINYNAIKAATAIDVLKSADEMMGHLSPNNNISLRDYAAISNAYAKGVEILLRDTIVLRLYDKMEKMSTIFPVSEEQIKNYISIHNVSFGPALKTLLYMERDKKSKYNEYKTIPLGQWERLNNDFEKVKNIPEVEHLKNIFADINVDEDARKYIGEVTKRLSPERNAGTHNALFSYDEVEVIRGGIVRQINELNRYLNSILDLSVEN